MGITFSEGNDKYTKASATSEETLHDRDDVTNQEWSSSTHGPDVVSTRSELAAGSCAVRPHHSKTTLCRLKSTQLLHRLTNPQCIHKVGVHQPQVAMQLNGCRRNPKVHQKIIQTMIQGEKGSPSNLREGNHISWWSSSHPQASLFISRLHFWSLEISRPLWVMILDEHQSLGCSSTYLECWRSLETKSPPQVYMIDA